MQYFTIRDIENLCDIKAHTLRIWEQRYNFFLPKRKSSNHRIYDTEDLKELLRFSFLYHQGYKISKLAGLSRDEIDAAIQQAKDKDITQRYHLTQLIEASLDFNEEKFNKACNAIITRMGIEKAILSVFYPFLERIGRFWLTNNIIPAQEHFASNIIQRKIVTAIDGLRPPAPSSFTIAIFSVPDEYHEIPLLVTSYFFRKNKIPVVYFGVNVPLDALTYYATYKEVTHFYTHIVTNLMGEKLNNYIDNLCRSFPEKKVLISGPANRCITVKPANLHLFHSLEETKAFTESMLQ